MESDEQKLLALQKARRRDRQQATTRRRRAVQSPPKKMDGLVAEYFGGDAEAVRRIEEHRALAAWAELVGPAAAAFSKAERVRNRQLVIRVRDPMWMQQLYLLKPEILRKYRTAFPGLKIDDIFYTGT
jgi:predicted nucleic acid-binding Zn ribbon protein